MPIELLSGKNNKRRGPSILLITASIIALGCVGLLVTLALIDGRFAGKPVVELTLPPEAPPVKTADAAEADKLLRDSTAANDHPATSAPTPPANSDANSDTPGATPLPDNEGPNASLSPEEQTLLDAAKHIRDSSDADDANANAGADGVKIVGAETVDTDTKSTSKTVAFEDVGPLSAVPDPALIASSAQGPLPIVAKDGRKAWQVYARPLPKGFSGGSRVAIVVSGLGISESATAHAIKTLPPEVTLSFAPYGDNLQDWITKARAAGHEVLLELPMEPFGFPQNDPGPYTLLTSLSAADNVSRLEWLMSRFTGYVGVMNYQGARFTSTPSALSPILSAIKSRGLMYIDNGASNRSLAPKLASEISLPVAAASRNIDPVQSSDVITDGFKSLEASAKDTGNAIGVASGFPVTVDAVAEWAQTLKDKGLVLVPVSATAH